MFEFLATLLEPFIGFFVGVYQADDRPEARRITVGCGLIVLVLIGVFVLLVALQRMK